MFKNCVNCGKEKKLTRHEKCVSCAHLGRSAWNKGLQGFMKGRITSFETKHKISIAQSGKKNHNWKGGITPKTKSFLYFIFKEDVIKRDESKCTICKIFLMYPIVHHIIHQSERPDLRYEINNGRTVCYDCHMVIHNEVGYYRKKRGEFSEELNEQTLSQAWEEISLKVQRIMDEAKSLNAHASNSNTSALGVSQDIC